MRNTESRSDIMFPMEMSQSHINWDNNQKLELKFTVNQKVIDYIYHLDCQWWIKFITNIFPLELHVWYYHGIVAMGTGFVDESWWIVVKLQRRWRWWWWWYSLQTPHLRLCSLAQRIVLHLSAHFFAHTQKKKDLEQNLLEGSYTSCNIIAIFLLRRFE